MAASFAFTNQSILFITSVAERSERYAADSSMKAHHIFRSDDCSK